MDNFSYEDAFDILKEVNKASKTGEKIIFITIPGIKKFLDCVDISSLFRDIIKTQDLKYF